MRSIQPTLIISLAIGLASCGRPDTTEIELPQFLSTCSNESTLDEECVGKFVKWRGAISSTSRDKLLVKLSESDSINVYLTPNSQNDVYGRKIEFSGYLQKSRWLKAPIVKNGQIENYLNSAADAKRDYERERTGPPLTDENYGRMVLCNASRSIAEKEAFCD